VFVFANWLFVFVRLQGPIGLNGVKGEQVSAYDIHSIFERFCFTLIFHYCYFSVCWQI